MESLNPCCCCLLRPSEKDVKTPYIRLGVTEIFSDMFEECFQIHLALDNYEDCGMCEVCVGRLRDASDFKLQVQRSQAELQARVGGSPPVKVEDPLLLSEPANDGDQCDQSILHGGPPVKTEVIYEKVSIKIEMEEEGPSGEFYEVPLLKPDVKSEEEILRPGHGIVKAFPGGSVMDHKQKRTSYCCNVCSKEFSSKVDFKKHKLTHKKKELTKHRTGPYSCEICNKSFAQQHHLKKHSRTHTRQNTISCKVCKKQFTLKRDLVRHTRTHTGQRPYSCEICNKSFTQQGNLTVHTRIHTGQKPFSCEICKKSFTQQGYLKEHARIHTGQKPFICEICNKKFTLKHHLVRHIRTHTGHKPYSCDICNKSFMQPDNLKMHIRTHTGQKPHICEVCNKSFTQKCNLQNHIKRTHTEPKTLSAISS